MIAALGAKIKILPGGITAVCTSLARIIAVYEIIYNAEKFIKLEGIIWPLFYTGAFYLIFCGVLTVLFGQIEKKLNYFN